MSSEIVKVLENIAQAIDKDYSFEEVEKSLQKGNKLGRSTLAAAYSWIYEKKLREIYRLKEMKPKTSESLRVFSDEEVSDLGLNNYNYLLHLKNIGLLDNSELELIIDQIKMFPEEERTRDNINIFVLSIFLDLDKTTTPGSRYLLYSSDTIN